MASSTADLISVIIPVYNVENYLKQCIESVINQTYTNLQIIIVDDGSTDRSGEICDEYAKIDRRIEVIHKRNGGLSDARNTGFSRVQGNYVAFLDSDDWITKTAYEELYKAITHNNADIAYGTTKRLSTGKSNYADDLSEVAFSGVEIMNAYICHEHPFHIQKAVWDKLYTKDIIGKTRFIKGIHGEDGPFTIEILSRCHKVVYCPAIVYIYRDNRPGNITNLGISERFFTDRIPNWRRTIQFLKDMNRFDLANRQSYYFYQELFLTYKKMYTENDDESRRIAERIKNVLRLERRNILKAISYQKASMGYRVRAFIFVCTGIIV